MKYVTIIDIARELGISKSTVSRALRGDAQNVGKETMRLIQQTAERMGYKRNEMAVNLRQQRTRTIGIVVPEMTTTFFPTFIIYAQETLNKAGYRVVVAQSHEDTMAERQNLAMMEDYRVDGILMSICHGTKNLDCYRHLIEKGIPIVFFDRTLQGIGASCVRIDDYIKAFFMVEHMIRKGRTHIVHLAGPDYIPNAQDRKQGYRDALRKFSLNLPSDYIINAGLDFTDGEHAIEEFIKKEIPFDATFGFTEMSVLGAKNCLQNHHYRIPEDVSVACISGTELCKLVHPSITTVEQPVEKMAERASELLIRMIESSSPLIECVTLDAEMKEREST